MNRLEAAEHMTTSVVSTPATEDRLRSWALAVAPLVKTYFPDLLDEFHRATKQPPLTSFHDINNQLYVEQKRALVEFTSNLQTIARSDGETKDDALGLVLKTIDRFRMVVRQLSSHPREDGNPVEMNDEYDVQFLLRGLLALHFDDIRPEEPTPSYAGSAGRMDFLLKSERIAIEIKFAKRGRTEKVIGHELVQDIARYEKHPDCDVLVCFVYDPTQAIRNPMSLEEDLARESKPKVVVRVRPR